MIDGHLGEEVSTMFACVRVVLAVVVAAATLLVTSGIAAAASGQSFATGGFQGPLAGGSHQIVAFSAHGTPAGVVGQVTEVIVQDGTVSRLRGNVVCLAVSGNAAAVGFEVLESSGILSFPYTVGSVHSLLVRDDDNSGDTFAFTEAHCTEVTIGELFPILHGNIVVTA